MSIYEMGNKEIRTYIRKFGKTAYGKVVFCLAYAIPLILTIACIEYVLLSRASICFEFIYSSVIIVLLLAIFISFILGSRYYYKELKGFIEKQSNDK